MRILVTGAAGFIGSNVCTKLLESGYHDVLGLDNYHNFYHPRVKQENVNNLAKHQNFRFEQADIRDIDTIREIFRRFKPNKVIHLAAMAGVPFSIDDPVLYAEVNVTGTVNLLQVSVESKTDKFILASSSSVYGGRTQVPFKETDRVDNPISPYAATKRAAELQSYTFHYLYGISVGVLRFFTVYGPNQRPYGMAIQKFIRQTHKGDPITIYGDGSMGRDYTYITDIVDGVVSALDTEFGFEIINLGNSDPVTLLELVKHIQDAFGKKGKTVFLDKPDTEVPITYADIAKAKKLLGYRPKVNIKEGIKAQVADFINRPDWYKNLPI